MRKLKPPTERQRANELIKVQNEVDDIIVEAKQQRKDRKKEQIMQVINKIKDIYTLIDGKKTYITAVVVAIVALLGAFGVILPEWLNYLLVAMGLVAGKSAVNKISK